MKYRLLLATVALAAQTSTYAEADKSVVVPFPRPVANSSARVFYCDAAVGAILMGTSDDRLEKAGGMAPGLAAIARKPTDRVVLVLEADGKTLSLFNRTDFEGGNTKRNTPHQIVDGTTEIIVAIAVPRGLNPTPVGVITLNRRTGIGSLTEILSNDLITRNPRIETSYIACGVRRE